MKMTISPRHMNLGICTAIGSLATARSYHCATLRGWQRLGHGSTDGTNALTSAEPYDGVNSISDNDR
jgi:hypothetical protein